MEEFSLGTRVVAGAGAIGALKELGAKRVYIVTDPFFFKNGLAQKVAEAAGGSETAYFSDIQPDPTVELAARGTAKLKAFAPDLLVALGGGSALDCAKAMAYFSQGSFPMAAVPTTSGSGSEVTDFAVLTHGNTKYPLVDKRLRPDLAILDSDFLKELPPGLIADTGFDVLTHAVEGFTAAKAGAFTDLFAQEAFRIAYGSLPASFAGRQEVRLKLHMASCMAGGGLLSGGAWAVPRHGPQPGGPVPCAPRAAERHPSSGGDREQRIQLRKEIRPVGPGGGDGRQCRHGSPAKPEKRADPPAPGAGTAPEPDPGGGSPRENLGGDGGNRGRRPGGPLLQNQSHPR